MKNLNLARGHYYKDVLEPIDFHPSRIRCLEDLYTLRLKVDSFKKWFRTLWKGTTLIYDCRRPLIFDANLFIFDCTNHGTSLGPTTLLLSVLDSIQRRFSAGLFCFISDVLELFPGRSIVSAYLGLDAEIRAARTSFGNDVYRILKCWYGLFVSSVINLEGDLGCSSRKSEILKGIREHIPNFESSRLYTLMSPPIRTRVDLEMAFTLTGLMKVYGHPIVDLASGLRSVRLHACKTQSSNLDEARHIDVLFKAEFCKAFYSKNGTWPNVSINPGCHPVLVHAIANQYWPIADKMRNFGESVFSGINLERTFEFDYHTDVFDILNDKANCLPLSHWTQMYDRCSFMLHHRQVPPRLERLHRRVVANYLLSVPDHTKSVIEAVERGTSPRDDDIIHLVAKEGELKVEARAFAVATYDKRIHVGLLG